MMKGEDRPFCCSVGSPMCENFRFDAKAGYRVRLVRAFLINHIKYKVEAKKGKSGAPRN